MKISVMGNKQAWGIWWIANLIVILGFNLQTGYAIVNMDISKEIGMNLAQVAIVGSVYAWVFSISQLFSGSILDNLGIRKIFPIAVFSITLGAILLATAHTFSMVLFSQVFLAIGASFGFVGAGFTGGLWFGFAKFGVMFGLVQTIASLGSFLGQFIYAALLSHGIVWRLLIWTMAIFGIIIFALVLLFVKNPVIKEDGSTAFTGNHFNFGLFSRVISNIGIVLKNVNMWLISFNGMISFGVYLAIAVLWGPKIIEAHGYSVFAAGIMSSTLWIGLAIFSPICDMISMKIQARKIVNFSFLLVEFLSLGILIYVPSLSTFIIVILILLFGAGASGHMQVFSAAADMVKPELIGTSAAIVNGCMFIGAGILISLPNRFLSATNNTNITLPLLQSGIWIYFVLLILAGISVLIMKESFHKK